jgi:DHA2 family multidrug resistance protein
VATGFALSFVFVPITTQAYSTLPNSEIGNASGIFNLLRNVGGSIGISIAQTLLVRRSDAHQTQIAGSVSQTQYWFEQQLSGLTGYLTQHTAAPNARHAAASTLYQQLGQQALLWSFVDVFRWMSLICFACVLLVWFFRKVKPGTKAPAGAH